MRDNIYKTLLLSGIPIVVLLVGVLVGSLNTLSDQIGEINTTLSVLVDRSDRYDKELFFHRKSIERIRQSVDGLKTEIEKLKIQVK